jgi:hypothetical protein
MAPWRSRAQRPIPSAGSAQSRPRPAPYRSQIIDAVWGAGNLDNGFTLGAAFVPDYLPQYRKEMVNRLSLTRLIAGSITGTRRELLKQGLLKT